MKSGWKKDVTEGCTFRVKENFRKFAELLEVWSIEELQPLPRAQWIDISPYSMGVTPLPSQQRKYIKYRYDGRLIYDPIIKSDEQNQTKLYFEVLDDSVYPRTNMPWARLLFRFNLIGSRDFTDVVVDVIDAGKPLLHALLKKLAENYPETRTDIERYLRTEGEDVVDVTHQTSLYTIEESVMETPIPPLSPQLPQVTSATEHPEQVAQDILVTEHADELVKDFSAKFDVVDSAVWAYMQRYEHYPADFKRYVLKEGAYVQYVIFPDDTQDKIKGHLGRIELRKAVKGTNIEFGEPYVKEREQTIEEQRTITEAFQEAVKRHKPDNFDANNPEQYTALDLAVRRDMRYRIAKFDVIGKIYQEQLETLEQYEEQRREIVNGLLIWLDAQGIKSKQSDHIRQSIAVGTIKGVDNKDIQNPWDNIRDYRWDRRAVQMLWEGYQDPEIAKELNVVSKTVTNRLSTLRQQYPYFVPRRDELKKKKLNR